MRKKSLNLDSVTQYEPHYDN